MQLGELHVDLFRKPTYVLTSTIRAQSGSVPHLAAIGLSLSLPNPWLSMTSNSSSSSVRLRGRRFSVLMIVLDDLRGCDVGWIKLPNLVRRHMLNQLKTLRDFLFLFSR